MFIFNLLRYFFKAREDGFICSAFGAYVLPVAVVGSTVCKRVFHGTLINLLVADNKMNVLDFLGVKNLFVTCHVFFFNAFHPPRVCHKTSSVVFQRWWCYLVHCCHTFNTFIKAEMIRLDSNLTLCGVYNE